MQKIFILILVMLLNYQVVYALENIGELEWNYRIILIRSTDESEEIINTLKTLDNEIQERDIYWFIFSDEDIKTNYQEKLQKNFYSLIFDKYFNSIETNVVLIGKDGGIKQKKGYLNINELFDLIDSMPMRKLEMRD